MFTGIILEKGYVEEIVQKENAFKLTLTANKLTEDINHGDSISVNGTCLTVVKFTRANFTVDVMPETFRSTNLNQLKKGTAINLEPALQMKDRFGGHFVSGHVDGIGKITDRFTEDNAVNFEVTFPKAFKRYILEKGSIAVDGISLTVFQVMDNRFKIAIIPHTLQVTNLNEKNVGDTVNLECDLLVKNVAHVLCASGGFANERRSE